MKNRTIHKQYVDDIIRELPISEYTSRFCEELLEHLEDCEEDFNDQPGADSPKQTVRKIGDKDLIIRTYKEFHRERHSKLRRLELSFYVIFSWLIFFITSTIPNYLESTYLYSDHPAPLFSGIMIFCAAIFCTLAINYTFYNFLSVRLSLHSESDDRKQKLLVIFFFLPAISALVNLMTAFSAPGQAQLWGILIAPLPFLSAFLPALINFKIICKNKKNVGLDATLPYLTLTVFLVFLLLVAATDKILFLETLSPLQAIVNIFYIFHFILFILIDVIVDLPFFALFPMDNSNSASYVVPVQMVSVNIAIAAAYVMSLGAIGVLALRSARKQKNLAEKRWNRAVGLILCAYAIFMFLPIKSIDTPAINWNVPAKEISKQIEKKQFGIFYSFIKFKNDDEGYVYNYDTCSTENGFIAKQSSGQIFYFDVTGASSIREVKTVRMEKQKGKEYCAQIPTKGYDAESLFFFQEGWKCLDKEDTPLPMGRLEGCAKITYADREIFKETYEHSTSEIQSIEMSADGNWALIKMADVYSVDFLYLADLREPK
ncbi:MAG: hypothetical protein WC180_00105 [Candidatus Paceibacterota bacterium]